MPTNNEQYSAYLVDIMIRAVPHQVEPEPFRLGNIRKLPE